MSKKIQMNAKDFLFRNKSGKHTREAVEPNGAHSINGTLRGQDHSLEARWLLYISFPYVLNCRFVLDSFRQGGYFSEYVSFLRWTWTCGNVNTNINRLPVMGSSMTFVPIIFFLTKKTLSMWIFGTLCVKRQCVWLIQSGLFPLKILGSPNSLGVKDDYMTGSKWRK